MAALLYAVLVMVFGATAGFFQVVVFRWLVMKLRPMTPALVSAWRRRAAFEWAITGVPFFVLLMLVIDYPRLMRVQRLNLSEAIVGQGTAVWVGLSVLAVQLVAVAVLAGVRTDVEGFPSLRLGRNPLTATAAVGTLGAWILAF